MVVRRADAKNMPATPRMAVVRSFEDVKAVMGLLAASRAVLVVLRASDADQRRTRDVLAGWALGSGGEVEELGPNTMAARPFGVPAVRLSRSEIVSAVESVFRAESSLTVDRESEAALVARAVRGSSDAQRQLVDAYAEFATALGLALHPHYLTQAESLRVAQDELERLAHKPDPSAPMLVALVNAVHNRFKLGDRGVFFIEHVEQGPDSTGTADA